MMYLDGSRFKDSVQFRASGRHLGFRIFFA